MKLLKIILVLTVLSSITISAGHGAPTETDISLVPQDNAITSGVVELYPEWWGSKPSIEALVECKGSPRCVSCHQDNSRMDPSHAISCDKCHGGDISADVKEQAHKGLIPDPGSLCVVDNTCGKCHPEVTHKVKRSPMALSPRMINQTLFAFGAKECSKPFYATVSEFNLTEAPDPSSFLSTIQESASSAEGMEKGEQISINLGADLLRRSCLRCHLHTKGSNRPGESKGKGCSACHIAYSNTSAGKPSYHAIVRNVGVTACLKCHNSNHVGSDFVGLYEKDHNRGFKSPIVGGHQAPTIYGSEQHRLSPDTHFRASMGCADCHTLDEIHGTGKPPEGLTKNVRITCSGCHVDGNHPSVLSDVAGNLILMGKKERHIPKWNAEIMAHSIKAHSGKLTCSACHAAWSFQDYGLNLMLDERPEYWKWSINASQNDPQAQALIKRYAGAFAELIPPKEGRTPNLPEDDWKPPYSFDWLNNRSRIGVWYRGWILRRWSNPPLGLDSKGMVTVLRPMYQYVISYVDRNDLAVWDRVVPDTGEKRPAFIVNPYTPHTTSKLGRSCHDCHGSSKAAGMGETLKGIEKPAIYPLMQAESLVPGKLFRWDSFMDDQGRPTQFSLHEAPAGPLPKEVVDKLTNPSVRHKYQWSQELIQ